MRRITASTLLLLFAAIFAFPLFATASQAQLPACCRAHGAHRCAMSTPDTGTASPDLRPPSLTESCPYRNIQSGFHTSQFFSLNSVDSSFIRLAITPSAIEQARAAHRISKSRTHLKRGPPSIPSLT